MASAVPPKYSFKVIVIGDSGVGKSALMVRFVDNHFSTSALPTIGLESRSPDVNVGDYFVRLKIWDTAGEERFRSIARSLYRDTHAAILMYSTTDIDSFNSLQFWIEEIKRNCPDDVKVFLVGGKADLEDERQVMPYDVTRFAESHNLYTVNTSAKTNLHVTDLFERIAATLAVQQEMKNETRSVGKDDSVTVRLKKPADANDRYQRRDRSCC